MRRFTGHEKPACCIAHSAPSAAAAPATSAVMSRMVSKLNSASLYMSWNTSWLTAASRTSAKNAKGLLRHWRRTVTVSAGYAALQASALALPLPASYALVLAASVMAAFLALLSWRLFLERERGIAQLRTFAGSDWSSGGVSESRTTTLSALAVEVLGARTAVLQPLGPMQALVPLALSYPPGQPAPAIETTGLKQDVACVRLPNGTADSRWLVPLWDARGLTGALLLGDKLDGGLYT